MEMSPLCCAVLVLLAMAAALPWGAMCQEGVEGGASNHSPDTDLEDIVTRAATGHPAIIFAMADRAAIVQRLPLVLSSLALSEPNMDLAKHLVVGVQSEDDLVLCQKIHRGCWLDDLARVGYSAVPYDRETDDWLSNTTARLSWRKVEVTRHVLAMGVGILNIDMEVIFVKNPFSLLVNDKLYSDIFFQSESRDHKWSFDNGHVNTGFFFAAPTPATKKLIDLWLGDMRLWEQSSMRSMLKSKSVPELDWKAMPAKTIHSFCFTTPLNQTATPMPRPVSNHIHLFRTYLREHKADLKDIVAFHFSCCFQPTPTTCSSLMMNLALEARLENKELMKV